MDEFEALTRGVLADLDGAGALADFLQENDRAKEAVLLRRRWKAWKQQRATAGKCAANEFKRGPGVCFVSGEYESMLHAFAEGCVDRLFQRYLRTRFLPRKRRGTAVPHECRRPRTCSCSVGSLEPDERCPVHGGGEWPPRCEQCGRLMKWHPQAQESA